MRYSFLLSAFLSVFLFASCGDIYEKIEEYSGEIVYPAKYDTIIGKVGYERVEIDLMKAGRIPSRQIKLGKAKKVLITYDDQEIIIDSLVSWVNITGLTQPKLYRFKVYTLDEYDNKSVPQEIALIPYTSADLATLVVSNPRVMASPTAAILDWPNGLSSVLLNYVGHKFTYTDKDGVVRTGERGSDSRFFVNNLTAGAPVQLQMEYKVIPKVNNRPIMDEVIIKAPVNLNMPTASTPFSPSESNILTQNGIKQFTFMATDTITKLTYPMHATSLLDLFYFSNLKELDLTGGKIFELPVINYDRNGAKSTVGGGSWVEFMRKAGVISNTNMQALKDLLETNSLKKVKYVPNSMGLDALLAPYVASGVVELVTLPKEVNIPFKFYTAGLIQDGAWKTDVVFPATDAPAGTGLENVYKVTLRERSASFALSLPKEYQFNIAEYRYLKFKVFMPTKDKFSGTYAPYQRLWPRIMNYMWAFSSESSFGQEYWAPNADNFKIADSDLGKWTDVTVDMNDGLNRHNRVIVMNIGGEPSLTFNPPADMIYYFSNFRFSKTN